MGSLLHRSNIVSWNAMAASSRSMAASRFFLMASSVEQGAGEAYGQ